MWVVVSAPPQSRRGAHRPSLGGFRLNIGQLWRSSASLCFVSAEVWPPRPDSIKCGRNRQRVGRAWLRFLTRIQEMAMSERIQPSVARLKLRNASWPMPCIHVISSCQGLGTYRVSSHLWAAASLGKTTALSHPAWHDLHRRGGRHLFDGWIGEVVWLRSGQRPLVSASAATDARRGVSAARSASGTSWT